MAAFPLFTLRLPALLALTSSVCGYLRALNHR